MVSNTVTGAATLRIGGGGTDAGAAAASQPVSQSAIQTASRGFATVVAAAFVQSDYGD